MTPVKAAPVFVLPPLIALPEIVVVKRPMSSPAASMLVVHVGSFSSENFMSVQIPVLKCTLVTEPCGFILETSAFVVLSFTTSVIGVCIYNSVPCSVYAKAIFMSGLAPKTSSCSIFFLGVRNS